MSLGGGCAENFGEPETIRQLASAYLETGNGLDQLVAELRREVRDTVPNEWRGATASDFQQLVDEVLNAAAQAADRARRVANAALRMARRLEAARREYDAAAVIAHGGGYYITDACLVTPYRPDSDLNWNAGMEADRLVRAALAEAMGARQEFRATTAETRAERALIWRRFIAQSMAMVAGGGRPPTGRGPQDQPAVAAAAQGDDQELRDRGRAAGPEHRTAGPPDRQHARAQQRPPGPRVPPDAGQGRPTVRGPAAG